LDSQDTESVLRICPFYIHLSLYRYILECRIASATQFLKFFRCIAFCG